MGADDVPIEMAAQVLGQRSRRSVAAAALARQRLADDPVELAAEAPRQLGTAARPEARRRVRRQATRALARRLGFGVRQFALDRDQRDPAFGEAERRAARQEFVEHRPERPDVAASIDVRRADPGLLRAHVVGRADHRAGDGVGRCHRRPAQQLGDSEVDHDDVRAALVLGHEEVARLEIAVQHALVMGVLDGRADLQEQPEPRVESEPHPVAVLDQRLAADIVHRKPGSPGRELPGVEDPRDPRVLHERQRLALGLETRERVPHRTTRAHELDRGQPRHRLALGGEVDDAHAALPERVEHAPAADPRRPRRLDRRQPLFAAFRGGIQRQQPPHALREVGRRGRQPLLPGSRVKIEAFEEERLLALGRARRRGMADVAHGASRSSSQARTKAQSRLTVAGETSSRSAVSSMPKPAKCRNSTSRG